MLVRGNSGGIAVQLFVQADWRKSTASRLTQALVAMVTRVVLLLVSFLILAGCSKPLDLALPKDAALKLTVNPSGASLNKPATTCSISPESAKFKQLDALLASKRSGWESSPATYVPGVVVTGKGFSINFQHGFAVVNFAKGQYTRSIPKAAYAFLTCRHGV